MKLKRLSVAALVMALAVSCAACGGKDDKKDAGTENNAVQESTDKSSDGSAGKDSAEKSGSDAAADSKDETGTDETGSDADKAEDSKEEAPKAEVKTVDYGRITTMEAPEGWAIGDESAEDFVVYRLKTEKFDEDQKACPRVQVGYDTMALEQSYDWKKQTLEDEGKFEESEVTIGDTTFKKITPEFGEIQLYGARDDVTLIIIHDKDIDENDTGFIDIVNNVSIKPES